MSAWLDPWVDLLATPTRSAWVHLCYGRTNERTNGDPWLRTIDHLTFRNARARHIRRFPVSTNQRQEAKP